jgi:cytochrome d ubiquinol oxidase subunit I
MVLERQTGVRVADFMNVYLDILLGAVYGIVGILLAFIVLFMGTAYYALKRKYLSDLPQGNAQRA